MPAEYDYTYRVVNLLTRHKVCSPEESTYGNRLMRVVTVADNPPSRRPKPDVPDSDLWKYPTAQPKQYKEIRNSGYQVSRYIGGTEYCGGKYIPMWVTSKDYFTPSSMFSSAALGKAPYCSAATKMRLAIASTPVNLGETLGEYRETAGMFHDFGVALVDGIRRVRRKLPPKRRPNFCQLSAAELMMSFGVMPLASVLFDSAQTLNDRLEDPIYRVFRVKDKDEISFTHNSHTGWWRQSQRAKVHVEFEVAQPRFTMGNALELAWELQWGSWMVDYLIPIGDWLSSLDAMDGVKSVLGTMTQKHMYYHRNDYRRFEDSQIVRHPTLFYRSHERFVWTDVPMPEFPRWKPSLSWRKITHVVSLLHQQSPFCKR